MADASSLEFRAIVLFLLEGIPHHVAGTWQSRKKDAQRDTAERALALYCDQWGEQFVRFGGKMSYDKASYMQDTLRHCHAVQRRDIYNQAHFTFDGRTILELLVEHCCQHLDACRGVAPHWSISWEADMCIAFVEIELLGVPHKLAGIAKTSEILAREDVSSRALWYLQYPGFQERFEVDPISIAADTVRVAPPPSNWTIDIDSMSHEALEIAERKTAIMRVQNRLQQIFSRQLKAGVRVWEWNYETCTDSQAWTHFHRASVTVPVMDKTFRGDWASNQRDAQLDVIQHVTRALEEADATVKDNK
jgi:hypothetical protein